MKISAENTLSQKQILSQNQSQSLEVLAMPYAELEDFVRREQEENPLLEIPEQGFQYERAAESGVFRGDPDDDRDAYWNVAAPQTVSLAEHLMSQLDERELGCEDAKIIRFVIDSLDDSGYLTVSVKELSVLLRRPIERVLACVERIRALDPAGVAADNLAQCLEIQLVRTGELDAPFSDLLRYHLEDVAAGRYQEIARALGISRDRVQKYVDRLRTLHPRPASGFGEDGVQFVVPDVVCKWQDGAWSIRVPDGWVGGVGLSRLYLGLMKSANDPEVQAYFQQRIARAKFVLQSIEKRRETMRHIAERVVEKQSDYLRGVGPLTPFTLRQLAAELALHESTIGRGVRDKFIQTPRGSMPMRSLFTVALSAEEDVSRDEVQSALRTLISAEDAKHPLSDQTLSEQLAAGGLNISRRTVAKYREQLGIPSTTGRKRK